MTPAIPHTLSSARRSRRKSTSWPRGIGSLAGEGQDLLQFCRGELTPGAPSTPPLEPHIDGIRPCLQAGFRRLHTASRSQESSPILHGHVILVRPSKRTKREHD